jgi:hypothetical protein
MTFLRNNALALVALFVALGGTSYAAAQIGSAQIKDGAVKGRDVKDGSLSAKELKPGTLLAGPAGPAGPAGAPGPSDAWVRTSFETDALGPDDVTILAADVPAGAYLVNGTVRLRNASDAEEGFAVCTVENVSAETGLDFGADSWDKRRMLPLAGAVELAGPGTVELKCRESGDGSDMISATAATLTLLRVATLHD